MIWRSNTGANVIMTQGQDHALVTLSYRTRDPKFAADYLVRGGARPPTTISANRTAAQRNMVDYVAHRSPPTPMSTQREALDRLLLQQERRLMMTEVDVPYAATILDGPNVVGTKRR